MGLIKEFEEKYWQDDTLVLGLDEAGRGPMAGPLVVAALILPKNYDNDLINDSKKLSEKKRSELAEIIKKDALYYAYEIVSVEKIDQLNIYQATKIAMINLSKDIKDVMVLSDAMPFELDDKEVIDIVKGDARSISIAGASILAKTKRDEIMYELDEAYPEYGFKNHKGYGTKAHKEAILKYGRTKHHRKSFRFKEEVYMSLDI